MFGSDVLFSYCHLDRTMKTYMYSSEVGIKIQASSSSKILLKTSWCHENLHWRKCVWKSLPWRQMAPQITSITINYWTVWSGADQRKHQSSASLAFVMGIPRWPVNSPHKGPVARKMFPFDDVVMVVSKMSNILSARPLSNHATKHLIVCSVEYTQSNLMLDIRPIYPSSGD